MGRGVGWVVVLALGCGSASGTDTTAAQTSGGDTSTGTSAASEDSGGPQSGTDTDDAPQPDPWPRLICDPLVPSYCAFPFPSNVFTVGDPTTATGRRLDFDDEAGPVNNAGVRPSGEVFGDSDGFSPVGPLLAHLPEATLAGTASVTNIERSLEPDSPTVVIEFETGQRVPHFVELDMSHDDDLRRALIIRPATRLEDGRRYVVAIRGLVGGSGQAIAASPAFAALRDETTSDEPSVEARRLLYATVFDTLTQAGVDRSDLQLAWDFTTASRDNNTAWLVHMRDQSLDAFGDDGPPYVIDTVDPNWSPDIAFRIEGRVTIPLYLDVSEPGGRLEFDERGLPRQTGDTELEFEVLVPQSALMQPAALLQYGHGLLGTRREVEAGWVQQFANQNGYVVFAVDWKGMAEEDAIPIGEFLVRGELHRFRAVADRLEQGVLGAILTMRTMRGAFASDPMVAGMIDPSRRYYYGPSQGGILGAVYMAVSTDVERGALGVPGMAYSLMLNRSTGFDPFIALLRAGYENPLDIQLAIALAQILWDRAEPSGYAHAISRDPLPGTPPHDVLLRVAIGDHQVPTIAAHLLARAIGAVNLGPVNRPVFGLETAPGPHSGSAMIEYEFGLPPEPVTNVPMRDGDDPHGELRRLPHAQASLHRFLSDGVAETQCDGPCDPQ